MPPAAQSPSEVRALAKPPVRKLAKDLGIDLPTLTGSGRDGVITRADVEAATSSTPSSGTLGRAHAASTPAARSGERETREPIKGVRKMMAQAMSQSAFTSPHVTEWITVDVTATMEFVARLKKRREFKDAKVSPLLVLSRAVMLAMKRTPEINSFWDDAAQEVVYKNYVNLGIAAATPRGTRRAQHQGRRPALDARARGRAGRADRHRPRGQDAAGRDGGRHLHDHQRRCLRCRRGHADHQPRRGSDPVLRRGAQAAVGGLQDGVDEIVVRDITTLALSFDHRHIDGEKGSRFLADVAGLLEDPGTALLF